MRRIALGMAVAIAVGLAICWQPGGTTGNRSALGNLPKATQDIHVRNVSDQNAALGSMRLGNLSSEVHKSSDPKATAQRNQIAENYGRLPLSFEPNAGQTNGDVRFLTRGPGYNLLLTGNQAVLTLRKAGKGAPASKVAALRNARFSRVGKPSSSPVERSTVAMSLLGANPNPRTGGLDPLPGRANYFIGNNPAKWRTNIPTYAKVKYSSIYPGVDMVYYGNQSGQLEYDFVVAPGVDPGAIAFNFSGRGQSSVRIAGNGDLLIHADGSDVRLHKPVVYQPSIAPAASTPVQGSYRLDAQNRVRFALGAYDHTKPLYIDPVLSYSTYIGGAMYDNVTGVAVLGGNAYITGYTTLPADLSCGGSSNNTLSSSNFIDSTNTGRGYISSDGTGTYPSTCNESGDDAFVAELNTTGSALYYYSYFGGEFNDLAYGIAVDGLGNTYIAGTTQSDDFPHTTPLPGTTLTASSNSYASGIQTGFVVQFDPNGHLLKSSYLGGSGANGLGAGDSATAITLDTATPNPNAYVTGYTSSPDFPTTGGYKPASALDGSDEYAIFVTEINWANSSPILKSTIIGGNSPGDGDIGQAIALDSSGNVYVTGSTNSQDFSTTSNQLTLPSGNPVVAQGGPNFAFTGYATELSADFTTLKYSTYLGGSVLDSPKGIAVGYDSGGKAHAYVAGYTLSQDFPTQAYSLTAGIFEQYCGNNSSLPSCPGNGFVSELNTTGNSLVYSTYFGGTGNDSINAIAVDSNGYAYVAGAAGSTAVTFPLYPSSVALGNIQVTNNNAYSVTNAFAAELSATGSSLLYSTYLGGIGGNPSTGGIGDSAGAIAVDANGDTFVGGLAAYGFPTTSGCSTCSPATPPALQLTLPSGPYSGDASQNGFVALIQAEPFAVLNPGEITCGISTTCPGGPLQIGPSAGVSDGTTTSPEQYLTVTNIGNSPLYFLPEPGYGGNAFFAMTGGYSPADFNILPNDSDGTHVACGTFLAETTTTLPGYTGTTAYGPLPIGQTCSVGVTFTPEGSGDPTSQYPAHNPGTETAIACVNDNAYNGLTALGVAGPQQCITLSGNVNGLGTPLTITASSATMPVGGPVPTITPTYTYGSVVNSPTPPSGLTPPVCSTTATITSPATNPPTIPPQTSSCEGARGPYDITYVNGTVTIGSSSTALTIEASSTSTTYGTTPTVTALYIYDGNPATTTVPSGLNISSLSCVSTVSNTSSVGTYNNANSCAGASGSSYSITYTPGNATVTPASITVTANPQTKVYGTADPALTYAVTSGALVGSDSLTGALTRAAGSNVGSYAITQGTLSISDIGNYNLTFVPSTLTITAAPITVTANPQTKVYGTVDPALTYAVTSGALVGSDSLTGALTRAAGSNVGSYAITQGTLSISDIGNYNLTFVPSTLTITAAPITVTANPETKVYGTDLGHALTYTVSSGALVGTDAFTGYLTRAPGESVGTYAINQGTLSISDIGNYILTFVGANYTITAAPITVTANPQTKVYGTADPTLTYSVTSGALVTTIRGVATGDAFTGALSRTAGNTVAGSPYTITQGSLSINNIGNYTLTFVGANFTITPATATVVVTPYNVTYDGNPHTAAVTSITGVTGETGSTVGSVALSSTHTSAGTYSSDSYSFTPTSNYGSTLSSTSSPLTFTDTINQVAITVTANPQTKVYGTHLDHPLTYSVTGTLVGSDSFTGHLTRATGETVGTYAINQGTLSISDIGNYALTFIGANYSITPAPASVTPNAATKVYGATDPAFSGTLTGFLAADSVTATYSRTAGETVAGSPYPISATLGPAGVLGNYNITYNTANFTITPATPTASTTGGTFAYTGSPENSVATVTGVGGADLSGLGTLSYSYSGTSGGSPYGPTSAPPVNAGTYTVTATFTSTSANYTSATATNTITITALTPVVYLSSFSVPYDGTPHASTPHATGVGGSDISSQGTFTTTYTGTSGTIYGPSTNPPVSAGHYSAVTVFSITNANYTTGAQSAAANDYISQVPLIITASSATINYGTAVPAVTASYSGFVTGDSSSSLTTQPTCSVAGLPANDPVGTYTTNCTGAADPNYTISYVAGSLTIKAVSLIITASSPSMTYGGTVPTITASYSGFVGTDSASSLSTAPTCSAPGVTSSSPVASYPTSCTGAVDGNYNITYVAGSLTVNPATPTITATGGSFVYNGSPEPGSGSATGVGNVSLTPVTLSYLGVSGTTYGPTSVAPTNVGTYTVTASVAATTNYNSATSTPASLIITPATPTVTVTGGTFVYNGSPEPASATATFNSTNISSSGTFTYTYTGTGGTVYGPSSTPPTGVGTYSVSVQFTSTNPDYSNATGTGSITINPATLTVTASNGTMTYGGTVPTITASYSGFVNGDTSANLTTQPTCSAGATTSSPVGTYTSSCSGAVDGNYNITYITGTTTVGKVALVITASNGTMTYGGTVPAITASYSGFVNGDTYASLTTQPTCSTTATSHTGAGTYPSTCSGAVDGNYTISYVPGTVTDHTATLTVTANSYTINQTQSIPAFSVTYAGFVNGDGAGNLSGTLSCVTIPAPPNSPGVSTIACSGQTSNNYNIVYVTGTLTILADSISLSSSVSPSLFTASGTALAYTYVITNTGSVPIGPAQFTVTANNINSGAAFNCGSAGYTLPVNGTITCNGPSTYTTTSADLSAGYVSNVATATGGGVTSNQATAYAFGSAGCALNYPTGTAPALSSVVFNESEDLVAFAPNLAGPTDVLKLWYTDEHAMTLGVRQTIYTTSSGTTTTNFPIALLGSVPGYSALSPLNIGTTALNGSMAGTDTALWSSTYNYTDNGRPLYPTLYITDITGNPSSTAGDWQSGSQSPIAATAVYGTWKSAVRTVNTTTSPATITVTPDSDPAQNNWNGIPDVPPAGFSGYQNQGYSAEVQWSLDDGTLQMANGGTYQLQSGHLYRVQVMVHDGDQNKTGGDVGEACGIVAYSSQFAKPVLTVTASSSTQNYGSTTAPAVTATYTGFTGGDTVASLTTQPTCSTQGLPNSGTIPGGNYPNLCVGAVDAKYSIHVVPGALTVTPAALTITAANASITQGQNIPNLNSVTYSGFVGGDGANSLTGTLACTTTATNTSPWGTYPITCTGLTDPSYNITWIAGTLTINPATLTINFPGGGADNGNVGTPYSLTLTSTGGYTPSTFSISSGTLPAGLTLNASTGVICGIPTAVVNASLTVKVTDSHGGTATATGNINIAAATALAITFPGGPAATGTVGTPYSAAFTGTGGYAPYTFSITAGTLATGLTLNPSTGVISGTPTTTATGPAAAITAKIVDSHSTSATANGNITINPPPAVNVSFPGGANGTEYTPFSATITATGGAGAYTFSISAGTLATGLTLNPSTGVISGTPTSTATGPAANVTVKVTDAYGDTGTANGSINIAPPPAINVSFPGGTNGTVGTPMTFTITATGGAGTYTYSISAGTLPAGLTLNASTGVISGTPTAVVSGPAANVTVKVTDSYGDTGTANGTINIAAPPPLTLTVPGGPAAGNGTVGTAYSLTLSATGGVAPYTYSAGPGLPAGLTLNAGNGLISGTPTAAASGPAANVTFTVTDSAHNTATAPLQFNIAAAGPGGPGGPGGPPGP